MHDFKLKVLYEYEEKVSKPMSNFKQKDINMLQSKHDKMNIFSNVDGNDDFQSVLKELRQSK